jgi:hypothetical protein
MDKIEEIRKQQDKILKLQGKLELLDLMIKDLKAYIKRRD